MMFPEDLIKKRILITGANGMLGQRTIFNLALAKNYELLGVSLEDEAVFSNVDYKCVDLTNRDDFKQVVYNFCPDFIINTAAFTNVDLSETERETAWKVNVKGVEYVAEAARVIDAHVIHISTDYVFDGKRGPYSEKSRTNPLGYYGRTKLASENVLNTSGVFNTIIRTNVLFGIADSRPDFVRWVVSSLRAGKEIRIVTDQINKPTFIDDLVQAISKIIEFKKYGLYNIGGREFLSRYDFTIKIADYFQLDKSLIKKIVTEDLNQPAKRPLKSGLLTIKAESEFGFKPHSIEESLAIMKKELSL